MQIGEGVATGTPGSGGASGPLEVSRWIELVLVDPAGRPVGDARYEIETPDGVVHRGQLDGSGRVRLSNLAASGVCRVRWPDLDPWVGAAAEASS